MFDRVPDFYPTPYNLIERMIDKIYKKDSNYVAPHRKFTILEPSAGMGHIVEGFKKYYEKEFSYTMRYYRSEKEKEKYLNDHLKFDVVEIEQGLSDILRGKGLNVIWDNFLTLDPPKFYDIIIANFPFSDGCDHLLKAINIQERIGGEIVCLINSMTVKNLCFNNRKLLMEKLEMYNADIEYIQHAFLDAHRKTDVEVALIYIEIPMKDKTTMFEKEFNKENVEIKFENIQQLVPNMSKIERLVFEYDMIKKNGIELFKEEMRINLLLDGVGLKSSISLCNKSSRPEAIGVNKFIEDLNLQYWQKFIDETNLRGKLPTKLRNNFTYNMEHRKDIAFTTQNAYYFYEELTKSIPISYEETVAEVFNKITSQHYYSDREWEKNIYGYNGWKSNNGFKINKKAIMGCYLDTYSYSLPETLLDLMLIFENISGIKNNYDYRELTEQIKRAEKKIELASITIDAYKKGTIHVTFNNKDHLEIFNILAGKGNKTLPPDFCEKPYQDMNEDEKRIVKDFGINTEQYNMLLAKAGRKDYLRLMG